MNVPSLISRQMPVCILLCTVVLTSGCASIYRHMKQKMEDSYSEGIRYYENNQFTQAIDQWNKVLLINPDHKKAREYKERALAKLEIQRSLSSN